MLTLLPDWRLKMIRFNHVLGGQGRHISFLVGDGGGRDEAEKDELASSLDKVLQASIILC